MEVKSCHNCKHWSYCMERGRGACGDYGERRPRQAKKKSTFKENLMMCAECLFVVLAIYAIILM